MPTIQGHHDVRTSIDRGFEHEVIACIGQHRTPQIGDANRLDYPCKRIEQNLNLRLCDARENRLSKCSGRPLGLRGRRLPELNLVPIQVIDPGKATVGFIHSFGVNLYSLLL